MSEALLAAPDAIAGAAEPEALLDMPEAVAGAAEAEALLTMVDSGLTPGTVPPKYALTKRETVSAARASETEPAITNAGPHAKI